MFIIVYTNVWLDGGKKKKKRGLTYLRNIRVKLSIESVSFLLDLRQPRLRVLQSFLMLAHRLHHLITLVQHLHHQLLKVSLFVGELRAPLAHAVLRDRRHHVAHHIPHFASCTSSQRARYSRQDYSIFFFLSRYSRTRIGSTKSSSVTHTSRAHAHARTHTYSARTCCTTLREMPRDMYAKEWHAAHARKSNARTHIHTHPHTDRQGEEAEIGRNSSRARAPLDPNRYLVIPDRAYLVLSRFPRSITRSLYSLSLLACVYSLRLQWHPRDRGAFASPMTEARAPSLLWPRVYLDSITHVTLNLATLSHAGKKKREGQARAISQIQRLSFILSVPFFFPSFLS